MSESYIKSINHTCAYSCDRESDEKLQNMLANAYSMYEGHN